MHVVVAADLSAVYAVGTSERAAILDYQRQTRSQWGDGSERVVRATPRLARAVRKRGGGPRDVRWAIVNGVADLVMEEN